MRSAWRTPPATRRRPLRALGELQDDVRRALLGGDGEGIERSIVADGLAPEARLAVYRHHVFTSLTEVLEAAYPVVCRLLDRRFFGYAADAFIRRHPPAGPCLFEYGGELAEFLADFPPCRRLAYLPDVARLEWAMNVAAHADDAVPLSPTTLMAIAPERMSELRLALEPSLGLVSSAWPIDRIWRANQAEAGAEPTVDLTPGGVRLEVRRRDDVVGFRALGEAEHALRRALLDGESLGAAAEAARAVDPALDLAGLLTALMREGAVTGFTLPPAPEAA